MSIYIYRSTDTSAPALNGALAGSLIGVLDACLVNGYGSKESMGWTKAYSGTNVAVYRMKPGTSQAYLGVDDTGTIVARIRAFADISGTWSSARGVNGYNILQFEHTPTDINCSGGEYICKGHNTTSVERPQVLISNGKIFYLWIDANSDAGAYSRSMVFGDFESYRTNDAQPTILIGSDSGNYNRWMEIGNISAGTIGHWLLSRWDNLSWSVAACKIGLNGLVANSTPLVMGQDAQFLAYPDPIKGGAILSPVGVVEISTGSILRGRLPGLQIPCHSRPFATGDTIAGASGTQIAGKTFEAFRGGQYNNGRHGCYLIETSDTQNDIHFK